MDSTIPGKKTIAPFKDRKPHLIINNPVGFFQPILRIGLNDPGDVSDVMIQVFDFYWKLVTLK